MKFKTIIKEDIEERVEIYAKSRTKLIEQIESLCENDKIELVGYFEDESCLINVNEIQRIYIENDKTYVSLDDKTYRVKYRLYQLEEIVTNDFIKINQSCLININYISKFKTSWGGSLLVQLKNGDVDYVSRRQTKVVKERMGI
jgi:DNA-binding LytR/AlgR family response regulator